MVPHSDEANIIKNSELFNEHFYLQTNKDVRSAGIDPATHFLLLGGFEGRDPSASFSTRGYLKLNPDVAEARMNALLHYELRGRVEGRGIARTRISAMHIPKTAGTSIAEALRTAVQPRFTLRGIDRSIFGSFNAFDTISEPIRKGIYFSPGELPLDADLVVGHLAYSTLKLAYPSHHMLTILREPRCRLLSFWLYWRSLSDEQLEEWGEWGDWVKISRKPFLELLTTPKVACQTDNLFVRMLVWPHCNIPNDDFIAAEADIELLDAARRSLATFAFLGAVEELNLATRLGKFLGSEITIPRENITPSLPFELRPLLANELGVSTMDALHARTRLDAVLWSEIMTPLCPDYPSQAIGDSALIRGLLNYIQSSVAGDAAPVPDCVVSGLEIPAPPD